ncbi:MAG TPA: SMC-Scp complex subunit ScpB [Candidatus Saccharimonadia bacterium]|nr:SMC-Scp complex subunit ScpB [Candidatus Saccharimonadia bacterium]
MPESNLRVSLAAILFVSAEPLTVERLSEATQSTPEAVQNSLDELQSSMNTEGICLSVLDGRYQLVSSPAAAEPVKQFLQTESSSELSRAALETLAIVAYRGPIAKTGIDGIRGVSSDAMLRNLLSRGLINIAGKSSEPDHAELYAISHGFLQHFGLTSPEDLPPIPEAVNED